MSNTPDIWSVLRGLDDVDDKLLQHPAFEQLPALLENDEAPECVARNGDADVYVATDRRIIHFKTDFWKKSISKVTPYLYNDIKTFRADMAFASIGCKLTINGGVKTLPMKKGDRQRFATVVRSHVSAHQTDESISGQAAQPATSQPPSAEKKSKMPIDGCAIMIVLAGLVIGGIAWGIGSCSGGPPSEEKLEERRKGFHCLSSWDGNHDGFERLVRARLNDPGSMKTYETRITPVVGGEHRIIMEFGAKNAFGGMVRHTATGRVDHETCKAVLGNIS